MHRTVTDAKQTSTKADLGNRNQIQKASTAFEEEETKEYQKVE
jgi:hypothetical protein